MNTLSSEWTRLLKICRPGDKPKPKPKRKRRAKGPLPGQQLLRPKEKVTPQDLGQTKRPAFGSWRDRNQREVRVPFIKAFCAAQTLSCACCGKYGLVDFETKCFQCCFSSTPRHCTPGKLREIEYCRDLSHLDAKLGQQG